MFFRFMESVKNPGGGTMQDLHLVRRLKAGLTWSVVREIKGRRGHTRKRTLQAEGINLVDNVAFDIWLSVLLSK